MQQSDPQDLRTPGVSLIVVGAMLFAGAAACAVAAADHMAGAAALCGPVARHCILCIASAGSLLASAGVVAAGVMLLDGAPRLREARSAPGGRNRKRG